MKAVKQMARLCRRLGSKPALQRRTGGELGLFELGLAKVRAVVLGRNNEEEVGRGGKKVFVREKKVAAIFCLIVFYFFGGKRRGQRGKRGGNGSWMDKNCMIVRLLIPAKS